MGILSNILGAVATPFLGPLGPALIGAGSSLLGGALSNKAERKGIAAQNAYNDPAQIRARAEAAGFNPLLFVGPGVGNQTTAASGGYMGAAIADAGMQIADQMSRNRELGRLDKLAAENKKLAEKIQTLTIRPKVGGVYAQREETPSFIGPRQPIRVRHAVTGKWYNMDPSLADRLGLKPGGVIIAEDFEAVYGDLVSEIGSGAAAADAALDTGDKALLPDPKPKPKPVGAYTTPYGIQGRWSGISIQRPSVGGVP